MEVYGVTEDDAHVLGPMADKATSFPAVFIQGVECPERHCTIRSVIYEVIRPDMIAIVWMQSEARSIHCPAVDTQY